MKIYLILFLALYGANAIADPVDTLAYNLYKDKIVWYSDLGYNSAPFTIKDDFLGGYNKVQYKHNQKVMLGFGVAYKWFALRIGFSLPGTLRAVSNYGPVDYQDIGLKFNIKKTFWDIDFRNYKGYSVQDAYQWTDSLISLHPNAIVPTIQSVSFSINSWYFKSNDFRMQSAFGKVGDFKRSVGTWYLKSTVNLFGVSNNPTLVPEELIDSTETKSFIRTASAFDLGVVPGYAYVYRNGNWQVSGFAGLGGVIQSKFYAAGLTTRGFLGLAPRIDLRFIAGYSKPKYFFWLTTEFDVKSISYKEIKFRQVYHRIQLVAGIRLDKKEKKKKRKDR